MERAWRVVPGGIELRVRVTPRGGRDALGRVEILSDGRAALKVRVRAVREGGAANEAVRRTIANVLNLSVSTVTLAAGATARIKTLILAGDPNSLSDRLLQFTAETAA